MKIKSIVLALALSLTLLAGSAYAQLVSSTDTTYSIRVDQITYGPSPVWKVTNFSASDSYTIRFTQPTGFAETLYLAPGQSVSLGVFAPFHEFSCPASWTPKVIATGAEPVFSDYAGGNATHCSSN